jgi:hypothetical protein
VTEKSEAFASTSRCQSSPLNMVVDKKRISEKMVGQGGRKAQGVTDEK